MELLARLIPAIGGQNDLSASFARAVKVISKPHECDPTVHAALMRGNSASTVERYLDSLVPPSCVVAPARTA